MELMRNPVAWMKDKRRASKIRRYERKAAKPRSPIIMPSGKPYKGPGTKPRNGDFVYHGSKSPMAKKKAKRRAANKRAKLARKVNR